MKEYKYKVKGAEYTVVIQEVEHTTAKVEVNGIPFEVENDSPMNMAHVSVVRPVAHVHHVPCRPHPLLWPSPYSSRPHLREPAWPCALRCPVR